MKTIIKNASVIDIIGTIILVTIVTAIVICLFNTNGQFAPHFTINN